ncbi:ROK family protein [Rhodococcus sp. NPDC003318]|uniref:ROK family protein n=1 Tax=Rhodococcus sp. NPDC003318 TaxID=3364503 RepID=UPI0036B6C016
MTALALDIGGTKFAAARVQPDGTLVGERRVATPASDVWAAAERLLTEVADGRRVRRIGIGSAGPVDVDAGTVGPLNIAEWRHGFTLVDAVQTLFPDAGITLAIDGACCTLAEYRFGAGLGTEDQIGMIVSTGVGGGVLLGGRIAGGRTGNAGHIGHIVVPGAEDVPCVCGGVGCLEAVASGPSAVRWANDRGWPGATGLELSRAADAGDEVARAALHRAGTAVGTAIASTSAVLDLDLAVVGGGFGQAGAALWEPMRAAARRHARLTFNRELRIVPAALGGRATLIGAGALTLVG